MRSPVLLHNMSAPPRTLVQHQARKSRAFGIGVICRVVPTPCVEEPGLLARSLGIKIPRHADAEQVIRERLEEHSRIVPLPDGCVVSRISLDRDFECFSNLTSAMVRAKSSGHIFLRGKQPSLYGLVELVVLVLPSQSSFRRFRDWVLKHDPPRLPLSPVSHRRSL